MSEGIFSSQVDSMMKLSEGHTVNPVAFGEVPEADCAVEEILFHSGINYLTL